MLCAIWYHLYNLKNMRNTHGGELLLVKLQAPAFLHECFSRFLTYENDTKSRKASHIIGFNNSFKGFCNYKSKFKIDSKVMKELDILFW